VLKESDKIDVVKEVLSEYLRTLEELNVIRKKFLESVEKDSTGARTYAATLKDYRGIQVKLLQTLAKLGVKGSDEDDLVKILSNLPEIQCDVGDCKCAYHIGIRRIIEGERA
jgi:hypothetical protein